MRCPTCAARTSGTRWPTRSRSRSPPRACASIDSPCPRSPWRCVTSSLDVPGGELKASAGEFQLRAKYTAYDRARLLGLILRTHPDGSVLRLGDIADVTDGSVDQHFENTSDGYPSESIWVVPQHDLVEVAEEVKGYVETLAAQLPDGIEVITRRDNARSFAELLDTLAFEGITGFCLVLLVLMLFLRTRVAVWAAVGVLISIFGAFWWLPTIGVTLNMLSLFGFVLAMGVLVDDAIIVSERIHELQEQGVSGLRGAIQGVREVAMPVTLGVTIGLVAFLPGLFVPPSWATQFMKPVAIVMILTLAFSLLESLLILPAHLADKSPRSGAPTVLARLRTVLNGALAAFIARVYRPFLERALVWRYATVAAFAALLMIGVAVIQGEYLQVSLEEDGSYGEFHVHLVPPIGTPYAESEARVKQFVDALAKVETELNPTPPPEMPKVIEGVEVVLEETDPQVYEEAQRFMRGRSEVKIQVRHPRAERQSIDNLLALPVRVPNGGQAPLGALAEIGFAPGYGGLSRADRQGVVELHVQLIDLPPQSPESISKDLEANLFPDLKQRFPGIEISRGEAAEEADEIMAGLKRNTLIALAVIYALLAVSFRSYAPTLPVPPGRAGGVAGRPAGPLGARFEPVLPVPGRHGRGKRGGRQRQRGAARLHQATADEA
ncbi:MAG: efflux RND transporter permease subunit [Gammaproteobacteria bacterium]